MNLSLPTPNALITGKQFIDSIKGLVGKPREDAVVDAVLSGQIPSQHKTFYDIEFSFLDSNSVNHSLVIYVLRDYLSVGTDDDKIRMPLWPTTAQNLADNLNCILPTPKLVNVIWENSNQVPPQPWGPPYDASMLSNERIVAHDLKIDLTIKKYNLEASELLAGHKKDVVITNKLLKKPTAVAIYGWHQLSGKPIQPLFLGHGADYCDYSHGIRFISEKCVLDGKEDSIVRIMQDQILFSSVSDEGPMLLIKQPNS